MRVIYLDQRTDWGQPVNIAARVDLTGMDTKNLHFYSYDKAANSYRRIEKLAYWIDTNGYLRFATGYAGDIIVSEGGAGKEIGQFSNTLIGGVVQLNCSAYWL